MNRNYNNNTSQKGFTLIELLAVMAIIGVLTSVTFASLSKARQNAKDKSAEASMQSILIEASLFHSREGSYTDLCDDTKIQKLLTKITEEAPGAPDCQSDADEFGVIVERFNSKYYCIDSTKVFGEFNGTSLVSLHCPNN